MSHAWLDVDVLHSSTCRLRSVSRQSGHDVTAQLVSALLLSRVDYCNSVLTGLTVSTQAGTAWV